MATAQLNARMNASLKEAGDRSLANLGYTPTRAVRALWGFASRNAHNPKELRSVLETLEGRHASDHPSGDAQARMDRAKEGPLIFECALREMGVNGTRTSGMTDDELREQAYFEKWSERGLL